MWAECEAQDLSPICVSSSFLPAFLSDISGFLPGFAPSHLYVQVSIIFSLVCPSLTEMALGKTVRVSSPLASVFQNLLHGVCSQGPEFQNAPSSEQGSV